MVTKVRETLAETKARLALELAERTQIRLASLKVEGKARADKRQSAKVRITTSHNLLTTTTTTTTTTTSTHTTTTTITTTTSTANEPTFQTTALKQTKRHCHS
jgi:hypothetical protein